MTCKNEHYRAGVDFKTRVVELGSKRYKIQLWDTAGQERYNSLRRGFYRGAKVSRGGWLSRICMCKIFAERWGACNWLLCCACCLCLHTIGEKKGPLGFGQCQEVFLPLRLVLYIVFYCSKYLLSSAIVSVPYSLRCMELTHVCL